MTTYDKILALIVIWVLVIISILWVDVNTQNTYKDKQIDTLLVENHILQNEIKLLKYKLDKK